MTSTERQSLLLTGEASYYKGARTYVHGSSLIPEIDARLHENLPNSYVSEIAFRKPLYNHGMLLTGNELLDDCDLQLASASGKISVGDNEHAEFVVFETPLVIKNSKPFDEDSLAENVIAKSDNSSASIDCIDGFSFAEHLSATMKKLCQTKLPQHTKWFWGALRKSGPLPSEFETLLIEPRKIIMNRFVSARVVVDGSEFGACDFVGSTP